MNIYLVVETEDRYITKFNKAINAGTEVIIQNADIDKINKKPNFSSMS